ncbi:MAG: threonine synthase [Woeseiaceae bacterium]
MKYVSTRGGGGLSLEEAATRGIAPDGGLFVPERLPRFTTGDYAGAGSIHDVARTFLQPFFDGSSLAGELAHIVRETFRFPLAVRDLPVADGRAGLLELFHGPTAAFKDIGAGFLAAVLTRLNADAARPLTILVATSGDTGSAVAAAFDERPGVRVVVLYPDGRVSARQAHQLGCWGRNVLTLAVQGSFDDCQSLVKAAFLDPALSSKRRLSSANSINIGRLLPQCVYYAWAALSHFRETGREPGFIVPTGNLGNAFACITAREAGLPIGDIILAVNANRLIADFLDGAEWRPRTSIPTLASAMDVGNPGNMERLRDLLGEAEELRRRLRVESVSDDAIRAQIREVYEKLGTIVCPHTATATFVYSRLGASARRNKDWILVATAHPAKFEQIVEPLIGVPVPLPGSLARLLARPTRVLPMNPSLESLATALDRRFPA